MSTIHDGGPAFPKPVRLEGNTLKLAQNITCHEGMSLRDWFAGQALAGWLASFSQNDDVHPAINDCAQSTAQLSYEMADAMLAARTQEQKGTEV